MKKICLALAILVTFFLVSGVYAAAPDSSGGIGAPPTAADNSVASNQKALEPYTWDFGQIKEGEIARHDFVIKNESKDTINIKEVIATCGCTTSKLNKTVLEPGESTAVEINFNSKGFSGGVQKYAYLRTDYINATGSLSVDGKMPAVKPSVGAEETGIQPPVDNSMLKLIIKGEVIKQDVPSAQEPAPQTPGK